MKDYERRKTIWLVVVFSILVSITAWVAPMLGGGPSSPGPGFILWGTAPLLISLLMRTVTRDWSDLGSRPAIRKNLRWYVVGFFALPLAMILTLIIDLIFSAASFTDFSAWGFLKTFLIALPIFFIFAIFEEVGWRGYLAPKLDTLGTNRYISSMLIAIVWASWHLPYIRELTWVYDSPQDMSTFIPRFYLVCFALAILYGEIRSITATFWPAVLMHAVGNAFGHPFAAEYVKLASGTEYISNVSNGLLFIAFTGLLAIAIKQWRENTSQPPMPHDSA
jgi:membrane protease YdiL (CAAX protease family)